MSGEETPPTTTARTAFRPNPPPKMGGLVQVKHDTFSAWTGGKPLHDWSDLDASAPGYVTEFRQPLQVQSHLEVPRILVQLGHIQRT